MILILGVLKYYVEVMVMRMLYLSGLSYRVIRIINFSWDIIV